MSKAGRSCGGDEYEPLNDDISRKRRIPSGGLKGI